MKYIKVTALSLLALVFLVGAACDRQGADEAVNKPITDTLDEVFEGSAESGAEDSTEGAEAAESESGEEVIESRNEAEVEGETEFEVEPVDESDEGVTRVFNLDARQFEFTPSTIEVKKGDTVVVNFRSVDVTHGFSVPEFGVNIIAPPGQTVQTEFVADTAGTFTFRCSVYCGAGHSDMTGTLIVNE